MIINLICRHGLHPSEVECPLHERYREAEHGIYEALSALAWGFDPPAGATRRVRDMSKLLVVGQCRARGVVAKRPVLSWRQGWRESTKEQGPLAGVSDHNRTGSDLSWPE